MNKTTSEKNDTTSQMRNKMTSLEQKTQELKQVTDEAMAIALHQVNRKEVRTEQMNIDLKTMTLLALIEEALFGGEVDMDSLNATHQEYLQTEVLEHAVKAKKLLIKLGRKPEMDSTVQRLLTKMNVKSDTKKPRISRLLRQNFWV